MTGEEIAEWLTDHPGIMAYICLLLCGSLVSFITLIVRNRNSNRMGRCPVTTWPLSYTDFALFIFIMLVWSLGSGLAIINFNTWITGNSTVPDTRVVVIAGTVMQLGMLYIFLRFRFYHRSPNEGSLSPQILSLGQSCFLGLFYFLASLPVVYVVSFAWTGLIEYLRTIGFNIDLPVQDAVLLIQETDDPIAFFGMMVLAIIVAPLVEENIFRAGVYRFFKGKVSIAASLVISGTIFGIIHGNLLSLPGLITVGVCLGIAYELSGSLRVPIFFHAFFNLNSIILFLAMPDGLT